MLNALRALQTELTRAGYSTRGKRTRQRPASRINAKNNRHGNGRSSRVSVADNYIDNYIDNHRMRNKFSSEQVNE